MRAPIPFFAALGVASVLVQDSLTRYGSAQADATVLVSLLAAVALLFPAPSAEGRSRVPLPAPTVLFLLFAGGLLFLIPSKQGLQNYLVWFLFPATAVLVSRRTTEKTLTRVYAWWLPATLLAALVYSALEFWHGTGYSDTLYSARGVGWNLLVAMALVVAFQRFKPAFLYWPVWLLVAVIGSTLTRAAGLLALVTASGVALLNRQGRVAWLRLLVFVAVMACVGYYSVTKVAAIHNRFTTGDAVKIGGTDLNTSGRVRLWQATWHAVSEHPWFGHGPGQSQYFIQAHFVTIAHPHNEYLRFLYDTGWVGLALWLSGMLLITRGCWRRLRSTSIPLRRVAHLAALLAMIDLLLGSITDNLTVYPSFMVACGTLLGLSMGLPQETGGGAAGDTTELTEDPVVEESTRPGFPVPF